MYSSLFWDDDIQLFYRHYWEQIEVESNPKQQAFACRVGLESRSAGKPLEPGGLFLLKYKDRKDKEDRFGMKALHELLSKDSAWNLTEEAIKSADNEVVVLERDRPQAEEALVDLQMSDKATLGAVVLNTGGILVDRGWLRLLGSGHSLIAGDIRSWNGLGPNPETLKFKPEGCVIVAYDIAGGFFAINNGAFDDHSPNVYYFAPDTLEWEDTEKGYTDFLHWALNGDLEQYYATFRWNGWEKDASALGGGQAMMIYPFLWSEEGRDVNKADRNPVPVAELWDLQQDMSKQLFGS